jgi:hypothetical protein
MTCSLVDFRIIVSVVNVIQVISFPRHTGASVEHK